MFFAVTGFEGVSIHFIDGRIFIACDGVHFVEFNQFSCSVGADDSFFSEITCTVYLGAVDEGIFCIGEIIKEVACNSVFTDNKGNVYDIWIEFSVYYLLEGFFAYHSFLVLGLSPLVRITRWTNYFTFLNLAIIVAFIPALWLCGSLSPIPLSNSGRKTSSIAS